MRAEEIQLSYTGEKTRVEVLRGLSLDLFEPEILCLIGPSGCGKSTLVRCLASLLPADSGNVSFRGATVQGPDAGRFVVYQDTKQLLPWLTCYGNVAFVLKHGKGTKGKSGGTRSVATIVNELLELVGMENEANRYPYALSGGMRQRVALARALASGGEVLLLDEPFGSLDALTREELQDLLLKVRAETQRSFLFVTHDLREAAYLGDRILVMDPQGSKLLERQVTIPRPRNREAPEVVSEVHALRQELERVSAVACYRPT